MQAIKLKKTTTFFWDLASAGDKVRQHATIKRISHKRIGLEATVKVSTNSVSNTMMDKVGQTETTAHVMQILNTIVGEKTS